MIVELSFSWRKALSLAYNGGTNQERPMRKCVWLAGSAQQKLCGQNDLIILVLVPSRAVLFLFPLVPSSSTNLHKPSR